MNDDIPQQKLFEEGPPYPGAAHTQDWAAATRNPANSVAYLQLGCQQGVAIALGDAAYRFGRKVVFDAQARTIKPA
ncbi:MAG: hypothetical protein IT427_07585 [Pirellulales bacterium]|nr:hypothetical protein [Pirellulales bacterium]